MGRHQPQDNYGQLRQDPAHSPAGQQKLRDACTSPISSLTPATKLRPLAGPQDWLFLPVGLHSLQDLVGGEQPWGYLDPHSPHL